MAKQIRAARHYQERDAPLRRLADAAIPGIKRDAKSALKGLGGLVPRKADRRARAGDWHGVVTSIEWGHFREVLKGVFGRIGKAREAGAQYAVQQINRHFTRRRRAVRFRKDGNIVVLGKDANDQYAFDLYSQEVQDKLRSAQDALIAELEQEARDAIEQVVMNGVMDGLEPEEIMDDIRDMIGLTARQSEAAMNYRRMLEELDPDALKRQLRNFLEDDAVQEALDAGQAMDEAMIDKLVGDYIDNTLDYRAEMIAETEATRAASMGLQDAYSQAIDRGVFPDEAVRQYWKIALDEKTCEICLSVPDMNPDGVGIDEDFDSIDGPQDAPPAHPSCRCEIEVVTDLDMLPDEGDEE